jgi:monovalent cation:H+ antiporter-2, CPA2 family
MEDVGLLIDLSYAMGAALLGGALVHILRQPAILGFLLAGIIIGPYTTGLVRIENVQTLANLGVALLMFALGTEFSLEGLRRVRRVAVGGGLIQIAFMIALGTLVGLALGYPFGSSLFLGGVIAISSSVLMLKLLMARGETDSLWGRAALGTGIVQDLAMVALIIILPELAAGGAGLEQLADVGWALLKGLGFLLGAYFVGTRLIPFAFEWIARAGSRELFILAIVVVAAGMAALGALIGISFALGAFVAGLIVSESEYSTHVLDEIIPVRDIFATLFFVSVGMLIDFTFLVDHLGEIALLVVAILGGKFLVTAWSARLLGMSRLNALRVGLLLAQIGEFSFVLAGEGLHREVLDEGLYGTILASALLTLVINPLLFNNARYLGNAVRRILPGRGRVPGAMAGWRFFAGSGDEAAQTTGADARRIGELRRHVVVCGYGRVGHEVSRSLHRRDFPFVTIDYNPAKAQDAREEGYLLLEGDSTNPAVLERAGIERASLLVVTLPDLTSVEQIVRVGREMNRHMRILARAHDARAIPHLKAAGANEVIQPEFEAGMEMLRQALRSYGVSAMETQAITGNRRTEHYTTRTGGPPLGEDQF